MGVGMQDSIHNAQQRAQLANVLLDLLRLFSAGLVPLERFGAQADDLALFAGLLVGTAEGRPMNASKLADFVGVPRPSVIRKLAELGRDGLVERSGGGFALVAAVANSPEAIQAAEAAGRSIRKAAAAIADQR